MKTFSTLSIPLMNKLELLSLAGMLQTEITNSVTITDNDGNTRNISKDKLTEVQKQFKPFTGKTLVNN